MFLDRLVSGFERRAASIQGPRPADAELADFLGYGTPTGSGISVTETTAMKYSAVWRCVSLLAHITATLPVNIFEEDDESTLTARRDHSLYALLHRRPNPEMTSFRWRLACESQRKLWGNAYNWIERRGGKPVALWNHAPNMVEMDRIKADNRLVYIFSEESGGQKTYEARDILHIRGLTLDGIQGLSVIRCAREGIGLGLAGERFGSTYFGNGLRSTIALRHPGKLSETAITRLKEAVFKATSGVENWNLPIVLQEGIEIEKLGISPEDSQYLELREHQVEDVFRWFGVPLSFANLRNSEPRANYEQDALNFAQQTVIPSLEAWETEIDGTLVAPSEQGRIRAKFNYDALLRGDMKSRFDSYAVGRQWGILSANECRRRESLNPIEDGDEYLVAVNMQPADKLGEEPPEEPATPKKKPARSVDWVARYLPMIEDVAERMIAKERKLLDDQVSKRGAVALTAEYRGRFYASRREAIELAVTPLFVSLTAECEARVSAANVFVEEYLGAALACDHAKWVNGEAKRFVCDRLKVAVQFWTGGKSHESNE